MLLALSFHFLTHITGQLPELRLVAAEQPVADSFQERMGFELEVRPELLAHIVHSLDLPKMDEVYHLRTRLSKDVLDSYFDMGLLALEGLPTDLRNRLAYGLALKAPRMIVQSNRNATRPHDQPLTSDSSAPSPDKASSVILTPWGVPFSRTDQIIVPSDGEGGRSTPAHDVEIFKHELEILKVRWSLIPEEQKRSAVDLAKLNSLLIARLMIESRQQNEAMPLFFTKTHFDEMAFQNISSHRDGPAIEFKQIHPVTDPDEMLNALEHLAKHFGLSIDRLVDHPKKDGSATRLDLWSLHFHLSRVDSNESEADFIERACLMRLVFLYEVSKKIDLGKFDRRQISKGFFHILPTSRREVEIRYPYLKPKELVTRYLGYLRMPLPALRAYVDENVLSKFDRATFLKIALNVPPDQFIRTLTPQVREVFKWPLESNQEETKRPRDALLQVYVNIPGALKHFVEDPNDAMNQRIRDLLSMRGISVWPLMYAISSVDAKSPDVLHHLLTSTGADIRRHLSSFGPEMVADVLTGRDIDDSTLFLVLSTRLNFFDTISPASAIKIRDRIARIKNPSDRRVLRSLFIHQNLGSAGGLDFTYLRDVLDMDPSDLMRHRLILDDEILSSVESRLRIGLASISDAEISELGEILSPLLEKEQPTLFLRAAIESAIASQKSQYLGPRFKDSLFKVSRDPAKLRKIPVRGMMRWLDTNGYSDHPDFQRDRIKDVMEFGGRYWVQPASLRYMNNYDHQAFIERLRDLRVIVANVLKEKSKLTDENINLLKNAAGLFNPLAFLIVADTLGWNDPWVVLNRGRYEPIDRYFEALSEPPRKLGWGICENYLKAIVAPK